MTATIPGPANDVVASGPQVVQMMAIIERLAADEFTGRRTGTPGGHAAARWLASQLTDLGATVRCDEFAVTGAVKELYQTPVAHWADGTTTWPLAHRRDFAEHLATADLPHPIAGPLRTMEGGEWAGAWLLDTSFSAERAAQAAAGGALGMVLARGTDDGGWMPKMIAGPPAAGLPIISVRDAIHQTMTAAAAAGTAVLTASAPLHTTDVTGINVYGIFREPPPGAISVLLTAHYDGVGDDPANRMPAACDNASGVAVITQAAQIITAAIPSIGIAVALLDAEEAGLHGAAHHAPQVPAGTFVINVDGAAALDEPAAIEAGGPARNLLYALDYAARQTGIPLRALALRSDNRRYASAGLPVIGIGMGMPGYQTPAETPDRVQPETLAGAVALLVSTVQNLASTNSTQHPAPITEIGRTELASLIRAGAIIAVEALPEHVFAEGHLPGALNIRPRRVGELAPTLLPDRRAAIAVYCADSTCDASLRVARHLTELGYTNVRRYTGGKQDWAAGGLSLETPEVNSPAEQ